MLDLLPDALADALGSVVAGLRREWSLEFARAVAEKDALLADLKRENAELRAASKAAIDEQIARVELALSAVKNGEPGPQGAPGPKGDQGDPGERGVGIASIERDGARLLFALDDERCFDAGEVVGPRGEKGETGIGVAGAFIDRDGKLVITLSEGTTRDLGPVFGAVGATAGTDDVPDGLIDMVANGAKLLAEAPAIIKGAGSHPPIVLNISSPSDAERRTVSKKITTRKDESGNLIADVVEQVD